MDSQSGVSDDQSIVFTENEVGQIIDRLNRDRRWLVRKSKLEGAALGLRMFAKLVQDQQPGKNWRFFASEAARIVELVDDKLAKEKDEEARNTCPLKLDAS